MTQLEIYEKLIDFKQELELKLRALHCLVYDSGAFDESIVMGLLHQERKTVAELGSILLLLEELQI